MKNAKRVKKKTPINTMIRFNSQEAADCYSANIADVFLYLGDIPQMPGHCAIVDKSGAVRWGLHTDSFEIVPEEDA